MFQETVMKQYVARRLVLGIILMTSLFSSNVFANGAIDLRYFLFGKRPTTLFAPFSLDQAGYVIDVPFKTKANSQVYVFYLAFKPKVIDGKKEQLHRLIQTLELRPHNDKFTDANGVVNYPRHGIRIPLRLTITQAESSQLSQIYDQVFERLVSTGGGTEGFIPSEIDGVRLAPGKYHIRLEAIERVPELADIDVELYVRTTGK